jgi:FkbH-like protein
LNHNDEILDTMRLLEALEILRRPVPQEAPRFRVFLACGFTPLDWKTYLTAHLCLRMPNHVVETVAGLYGDLIGSLERIHTGNWEAVVVPLEWVDLDTRLGWRSTGGWRAAALSDIVESARKQLARLEATLQRCGSVLPVAVSLPTLLPPPVAYQRPLQESWVSAELENARAGFVAAVVRHPGIRLLSRSELDVVSPTAGRLDLKSELTAGFPYSPAHAEMLAGMLADLICPPASKKGLITDLDDTLWDGILGETGVAGVYWDLEHKAQLHAAYQHVVQSLADSGVLVAVASKNDPALVEEAFRRSDLALQRDSVFPLEAHWVRKSESVARILKTWNIAADAVVFVDDSSTELAEVQAAFPEIECLRFPKESPEQTLHLFHTLRERFGRESVSEEDKIRLASLRSQEGSVLGALAAGANPDDFLASAEAVLTLDWSNPPADARPYDLVNKTNQFNLNGKRCTETEWAARLQAPGAFLMVVSYHDRFGPLGRIAVMTGRQRGSTVEIENWVMSCRAFSRRIEHRCLELLFQRFGAEQMVLAYQATPRNGPLQEFLAALLGRAPVPGLVFSREEFIRQCPPLYHQTQESSNV